MLDFTVEKFLTFDDVLLMPNYSEIVPVDVDLRTELSSKLILTIPILSAPMDTVTEQNMLIALARQGGLGILHRNLPIAEQAQMLKEVLDLELKAGAAVGVGADFKERVDVLAKLRPSTICIDSAHGHTKNVIEATRYIKLQYPEIYLVVGNTSTYAGTKALFEAGASAVKVGMGSGSICTTRIMSGVGVPQLSAIIEAAKAAREFQRPIIADGGIKTSGDIVKALAAGASAVMLGSLLAGTDESVGEIVELQGKYYKSYRGMGSVKSMVKGSASRYGQEYNEGQEKFMVPEGVEGLVPSRGPLDLWLNQLMGGLRAGFAYLGSKDLNTLHETARFIQITQAGVIESKPHSILQGCI
ncbi:MAG: IMP dehydrogenase [Parachlamydiaceae bacterium]|nr:IMP dehydrogenase [Parachlamydiaceae bacterium]